MDALGLIFSNIHEDCVREITQNRTMASVPFGGRYRIIDFVLSNMTNAGIKTVGIITKTNYQSLMDHVGSGKEWNLARKNGGLHFLPPFGISTSSFLYKGKVQALKSISGFLMNSGEKYVVLSDCDIVATVNLKNLLEFHIRKKADITMSYITKKISRYESSKSTILNTDFNDRITKLINEGQEEGFHKVSMNIWIMEKSYLMRLIEEAVIQGARHIEDEVLSPRCKSIRIFGYNFKGFAAKIDSLTGYYTGNMELLDRNVRKELFSKNRVYTKIKDAVPTYYGKNCKVINSIIGDGCYIEGNVRNSILFRGVRVGENSSVESSIIMQDSSIGEKSMLNSVILDKNVVVEKGRSLSGYKTCPFYIAKGERI